MRVLQTLLSVVLITTCSTHSIEKRESAEKRVVCYYTNWSVYRPGTAKYNPQNINPYLCTHLIYAFGGLDRENGLRPYDKYQDIEQGGYAKFTGLKSYNKNLKTMLAIGGWNEGSARFSPLVADEERRQEFVKNVVKFLRVNHFDGLDLDWEYPAFRDGGKPRDRDNYAQLVQELREEFDREHSKTGRPRLLLTMAVPAGIEYIDKGYDVPKLNKYLDFMNILSYDYHSAFEPAVNHHSPLFPMEEDNEYNFDSQLSIDYTIKHYLKSGADRDKLVLGIPTYGRSYTLFNPESTDIGAPADGPGEQGDATREKGYLAYYEICGALKSQDDWTVVQPKPGAMGPYAYRENQWVGYDDLDIVKQKAHYVNDQSLGGIMFWSIDNDDFRGKCHDRPYPLIEAAKEAMFSSSASNNNLVSSSNKREKSTSPLARPEKTSSVLSSRRPSKPVKPKPRVTTTTTPSPSRAALTGLTTPEPPTTPDPGSDFVCKDEGFFPHPRDCKKYFWCLDSGPSNLGIVAHQFTCPSGLFFNKAADSCDYTRNVLCNNKKEKATTAAPKVTTSTTRTTAGRAATTTTSTTTTTTTTEAPIEEFEEEEEEEHEQEDPESIKQLIQLIKKLGGVAELEKQLEGAGSSGVSTPSIPRSLYNKVLTPQRPRYQSPYRNGPSGPQNEGLSQKDDGSPYRREKPQYVTIRRDRPSTEAPEEDVVIVEPERPSRVKYTNIQRSRPSGQYEVTEPDEEEEVNSRPLATSPRYQTIERTRPPQPLSSDEERDQSEGERFRPKYSSIQRSRPTTVEAVVESTTPRYVTLRRQRPQSEQQEEESTIKHTGETVVIEAEEEIKPIEIDVEEPISTSVRPRVKVSESPSTTTEHLYIVTAESTRETESTTTTTTTTEQPTVYTLTTESNTEIDTVTPEMTSSQQTTVPYQTSTLTSIVTVIVEGATERRRVPLTKLKQALADHDLLSNSVSEDKKPLAGKSSVLDIADKKQEKVTEEKGLYIPIGSYRGRPRKPIVIEPPTTKALPLYLQRRRTTTTEIPSKELTPTEAPSTVRPFGQFTPSRSRDKTTTEVSLEDESVSSTPRSNRYRTTRPSVGGSRFISSRGRTRSTTASPSEEELVGKKNEKEAEGALDVNKKRRKFGESRKKDRTNVESLPESISEKPTRLFSRGRIRTTTEKSSNLSESSRTTVKTPSRSRFVLNRIRNRTNDESLQRTRLAPVLIGNNTSSKNNSTQSNSGSRFQIQRRRKIGSTPGNNNLTKELTSDQAANSTENPKHSTSEEEHEMLISQENASLKPNQLTKDINNKTSSTEDNFETTPMISIETNSNSSNEFNNQTNINSTQSTFTELDSVSSATEILDEFSRAEENKNNSQSSLETSQGGFLNNIENDSKNRSQPIPGVKNKQSEISHSEDEEVLSLIASKYSEQSYTGMRGSVRFQEKAESEQTQNSGNALLKDAKKNNSLPTRRRKINPESSGKDFSSIKPNEELDKASRRRKVLVRKNKVIVSTVDTDTVSNLNKEKEKNIVSRARSTSRFRLEDNPAESYQLTNSQSYIQDSPTKHTKNNNIEPYNSNNDDFKKINTLGRETQVNENGNSRKRKIKVLKSRNQVENTDIDSNPNSNKRRVVLRKRTKVENEDTNGPSLRRGGSRFQPKYLSDLDTGTSLYVQRETDSDETARGSFPRSVKDQPLENSLINDPSSRGKIKAVDSLLDDIDGVLGVDEDSTDYPTDDQSEVGGNRAKVSFRRPLNSSSRSRSTTTTEAAIVTERPTSNKFYRRRVTKYKPEQRNITAAPTSTEDVFETTVKPRRFEFPRRTVRPNLNVLPQQAALVATSAPFVHFDDNHSDESLHEVDTERVESKELFGTIEDSTLPDLANVAVVAIQSLATAPPSTETFAPVTASTLRRQTNRYIPSTTPTTTERPRPTVNVRRGTPRPFAKISPTVTPKSQYISRHKPYDDLAPDYEDYYAEPVDIPLSGKVRIHNDGYIECLDIGNFPHPFACKKFISCAKMENEHLLGWEYTCPRGLSFDPIGGICNWSAGLGCKE